MLLMDTDLSHRERQCLSNSDLQRGPTAWSLLPFYMHCLLPGTVFILLKFSYLVQAKEPCVKTRSVVTTVRGKPSVQSIFNLNRCAESASLGNLKD